MSSNIRWKVITILAVLVIFGDLVDGQLGLELLGWLVNTAAEKLRHVPVNAPLDVRPPRAFRGVVLTPR